MKPTLLSVKELAQELGVSTQSIRRAYWDGLIPGYRFHKMLRFDVERIRQILLERGLVTMRSRRARLPAKAGGAHRKAPVR
jgi:hypothetical protein